jgi:hypothetical protein
LLEGKMAEAVTTDSLKMAVEITVAGMPMQSGSMVSAPDAVAKFIETVARKIDELRFGPGGPHR